MSQPKVNSNRHSCWFPRASLRIIRPTAAKPQLNEFTGLKLAPAAA